jgi:hypothetical protein
MPDLADWPGVGNGQITVETACFANIRGRFSRRAVKSCLRLTTFEDVEIGQRVFCGFA